MVEVYGMWYPRTNEELYNTYYIPLQGVLPVVWRLQHFTKHLCLVLWFAYSTWTLLPAVAVLGLAVFGLAVSGMGPALSVQ
jgi:hypothetical protein